MQIVAMENSKTEKCDIVVDVGQSEASPKEPISVEQLPNLATSWAAFLEDITKDRKLRAERLRRQSEDVMQFINRFPLLEMS